MFHHYLYAKDNWNPGYWGFVMKRVYLKPALNLQILLTIFKALAFCLGLFSTGSERLLCQT